MGYQELWGKATKDDNSPAFCISRTTCLLFTGENISKHVYALSLLWEEWEEWLVVSRKHQSFYLRAKQGITFPAWKRGRAHTAFGGPGQLEALASPCDNSILVSFLIPLLSTSHSSPHAHQGISRKLRIPQPDRFAPVSCPAYKHDTICDLANTACKSQRL